MSEDPAITELRAMLKESPCSSTMQRVSVLIREYDRKRAEVESFEPVYMVDLSGNRFMECATEKGFNRMHPDIRRTLYKKRT